MYRQEEIDNLLERDGDAMDAPERFAYKVWRSYDNYSERITMFLQNLWKNFSHILIGLGGAAAAAALSYLQNGGSLDWTSLWHAAAFGGISWAASQIKRPNAGADMGNASAAPWSPGTFDPTAPKQ